MQLEFTLTGKPVGFYKHRIRASWSRFYSKLFGNTQTNDIFMKKSMWKKRRLTITTANLMQRPNLSLRYKYK